MAITQDAIMGALKSVTDPNTHKEFAATRSLKNLQIADGEYDRLFPIRIPEESVYKLPMLLLLYPFGKNTTGAVFHNKDQRMLALE